MEAGGRCAGPLAGLTPGGRPALLTRPLVPLSLSSKEGGNGALTRAWRVGRSTARRTDHRPCFLSHKALGSASEELGQRALTPGAHEPLQACCGGGHSCQGPRMGRVDKPRARARAGQWACEGNRPYQQEGALFLLKSRMPWKWQPGQGQPADLGTHRPVALLGWATKRHQRPRQEWPGAILTPGPRPSPRLLPAPRTSLRPR